MKINRFLTFSIALILCASFSFMSCSKDDNSSSFKDVTLYHGNTYTIENGSDVSWESSNELVASVTGNTVTAICVGEAIIKSTNGSFKVTVSPKYNNVTLPSMNFGASMSTIKSEMSKYTLAASTSESLLYNADSPLKYYMYGFKNSGLKYSYMLCKTSNFETVANYVKERYAVVNTGTSSSGSTYVGGISTDESTILVISYTKLSGTYYYYFAFAKYTPSSSSKAFSKSHNTEIDFSAFEDMIEGNENLPEEAIDYLMSK